MCVVRIVATEPTHTRRTCRLLCVFFACLALSRPPCLLRPFPQVTLLDKFMEAKQQSRRRRERHERAVAFPQNFEAGEYHSSAEREEKVVESTSSLGLESLLSEHWIMSRDSSHCRAPKEDFITDKTGSLKPVQDPSKVLITSHAINRVRPKCSINLLSFPRYHGLFSLSAVR